MQEQAGCIEALFDHGGHSGHGRWGDWAAVDHPDFAGNASDAETIPPVRRQVEIDGQVKELTRDELMVYARDPRPAVRAAIYRRVSTLEQEEEGHSLDEQLARGKRYVEDSGWVLAEVSSIGRGNKVQYPSFSSRIIFQMKPEMNTIMMRNRTTAIAAP